LFLFLHMSTESGVIGCKRAAKERQREMNGHKTLQFDLELFLEILRPLIAVIILGVCLYYILRPQKS
jgi:hypothetical protein